MSETCSSNRHLRIMPQSAFMPYCPLPKCPHPRPRRPSPPTCSVTEGIPGTPATGPNARRLAKWLSADWSNRSQAIENPTFWAHIHVCFRPLPWSFLSGYSLYCESAYDYNLGLPYKTSVVLVINAADGDLELESYKLANPEEYWLGAHEPELLQPLTADQLVKLDDACNTMYKWNEKDQTFWGSNRPGKGCRIRRGGKERETYLDSKLMLSEQVYAAWDQGFDPETDERVWGTAAGPFVFDAVKRLDHLVPDEPLPVPDPAKQPTL
eukprot:GFKZ01012727.1.p1 GENE.GFKZ01012727.1~~GFKZ01012727.1.p1  ORF type:complete len:267 (+),score=21.02 GFKZ01012727.1:406-1206(+)